MSTSSNLKIYTNCFEKLIQEVQDMEIENKELKIKIKNLEEYCFECNETINNLLNQEKKTITIEK